MMKNILPILKRGYASMVEWTKLIKCGLSIILVIKIWFGIVPVTFSDGFTSFDFL